MVFGLHDLSGGGAKFAPPHACFMNAFPPADVRRKLARTETMRDRDAGNRISTRTSFADRQRMIRLVTNGTPERRVWRKRWTKHPYLDATFGPSNFYAPLMPGLHIWR